jgi:hypothetical protein
MENNQQVEPIPRCTGAERISWEMEDYEQAQRQRRKPERQLSYGERQFVDGIVSALFGDSK